MTANQLIRDSLIDLGYIGLGGEIDDAELDDAFRMLQAFTDSLPNERLSMHQMLRSQHDLSANKGVYTIGAGGEIDIARPEWIDHAGIIINADASNREQHEYPVRVVTDSEWARVSQKGLSSSYVNGVWYDYAFSSTGRGNLHVYPVPSLGNTALVLYTPQVPVKQFADRVTDYTWAPGVWLFMRSNLAILLAPSTRQTVTEELRMTAKRYADRFYSSNTRPSNLVMPPDITGGSSGDGVADIGGFISGNIY